MLAVTGGVALIALLVVIQAVRGEPLMPLSIFRVPNLAAANVVIALLGAAWIPMWFPANLWLQQVLGSSPFAAGAALLPMTVLILVVLVGVIERIVTRVGFKAPMVAGLMILAAGIALFARLPSDGGGYLSSFLPASLVAALGMSLTFIPALMAAIGAAPPEQGGLASGMFNTTYQVGSALGLAALTALSISYGADHVGDARALTHGFHAAFLGGAGVAVIGSVTALTLIRTPKAATAAAATAESPPEEVKLAA